MYLINLFLGLFKKKSTTPTGTNEGTPLVPSRRTGFTAEYTGYGGSEGAVADFLTCLAIYYILAIVGYSFVFQNWSILDSMYLATTMYTLLGYPGDVAPDNTLSKIFTACLAFYGILVLGVFVGYAGNYMLVVHEESVEARKKNATKKVIGSFKEKQEEKPLSRERKLFKTLCDIVILELPIIIILFVLAVPIGFSEGWEALIGIYSMTITSTTIGFDDITSISKTSTIIFLFYLPLALAVRGEFMLRVANAIIDHFDSIHEDKYLDRTMTMMDLKTMDVNESGEVSRAEFLSYMLVALQKIDKEEIDEIMEIFDRMDTDKSGVIGKNDLEIDLNHVRENMGTITS